MKFFKIHAKVLVPKFVYPPKVLVPNHECDASKIVNFVPHHALYIRDKALHILNFLFRSLLKIIKVLIKVITSQTFECFWISVTQIRSNHVNRNWYSAGQEIISIEDYLLLPFNSTELLEPHCKHAPSKQTAWISHFWANKYSKCITIIRWLYAWTCLSCKKVWKSDKLTK